MIRISALIILFTLISRLSAQKDTIPTWLDTIPPVVKTSPINRIHSTPFYVSIKANENGRIFYGINNSKDLIEYKKNISVSRGGQSKIYFYAEDVYGNKSHLDSVIYELDFESPRLIIKPDPGIFRKRINLQISSNERCRFYRHNDPSGKDTIRIFKTFVIDKQYTGYISAIDRAGNITRSSELRYIVDTSSISVSVQPAPGIYTSMIRLSFKSSDNAQIFYTFDHLAPPEWFKQYYEPVPCPYGLTMVRYFARNEFNRESVIMQARFVIDTIPPKIRFQHKRGSTKDTLILYTKDKAKINYILDKGTLFSESYIYEQPITFPHSGMAYVKAIAKDRSGNVSESFVWKYKYDHASPTVTASHASGTYTRSFTLTLKSSEPAQIMYTLDNSEPDYNALIYNKGITISKNGNTRIRYIAIDNADNISQEGSLDFILDFVPPSVRVRIKGSAANNDFKIALLSNEFATIYYEIGAKIPTRSSTVYKKAIELKSGQILKYFAVDNAGNQSDVHTMDDLLKPVVTAIPDGGVFKSHVRIYFARTFSSKVYWRIFPDTVFALYKDTIVIDKEGSYSLEYYSQSIDGTNGPIKNHEYLLDWTVPRVNISIKKGISDSVSLFFNCSENASFYYTVDGTSPFFSRTTQMAGNKFNKSEDRISIYRSGEVKLAFFAEDMAGNQSNISVLDIFSPRAIPSIPSGTKRIYNRILSLALNTYDDRSQIYYERHGKTPTIKSTIHTEPITLMHSDTISAFVIDASGFKGKIDKFIYLIDLPPLPHFTFSPQNISIDKPVTFNASGTIDHESDIGSLKFQWDFDGNGKIDYTYKGISVIEHVYRKPGKYNATLTIVDPMDRSQQTKKMVEVKGRCPKNMTFVPREDDASFCIDKYEWPNKRGKMPKVNVSWIRAKMYCHDLGKRLCSADEWEYACSGGNMHSDDEDNNYGIYPYGNLYKKKKCPSEGDKVYKSGQFNDCEESYGTFDMVGNVWEWTSDNNKGAPVIIGGSFQFGPKAKCGFNSESSMIAESRYSGFRCCR